ncbi:MAG TPA: sigma-54 dependent transcriptional regulator [Thermoanaerobaculaceae bacterium]|nr:sigma-54 dependent transcriptional regulator [Thermoanaerobaculaceae bacterium]HRS16614.1 sigma-54 dependent transcriptional regulator [Thermoanaerobaculaceae bacterium]
MALCLVVEDDPRQRAMLEKTLRAAGFEALGAADGRSALAACALHRPEVVLLDLGLPDIDGLELLPLLQTRFPLTRVIVLTGLESVATAVAAMRAGARHYLTKPWQRDELLVVVERELRAVDLAESLERRAGDGGVFWGTHVEMLTLRGQLAKLAAAPRTSVLFEGETGSGKEVLAAELHRQTGARGAFVALNCAAVPSELLESELFGHERGAFTGAEARRRGVAELAREGTLLLDEVADLPLPLQAKLLRFLQEFRFRRLGGEEEISSPCRVVAATHRDLEALVHTGGFRSDLFFRLAVVRLRVPALRERRADILPLCRFLLERICRSLGRPPRALSPAAEQAVLAHPWPGNVRELANRLERAMVLGDEATIQPADLDLGTEIPVPAAISALDDPARLRQALERNRWNLARTAREFGVARHILRYRVRKLRLMEPTPQ